MTELVIPYRSGLVNAVLTVCLEIILSSIILWFCLRSLQDAYESRKLEKGEVLYLDMILRRRKNTDAIFLILTTVCFIFIELGINGTQIDWYDDVYALEVNHTDFASFNDESSVFHNSRLPSPLSFCQS